MIALASSYIAVSSRPSRAPGTFCAEDAACEPREPEAESFPLIRKKRKQALSADQERSWNRLRGVEAMSMCDWPGRASCVLFLGGCNLHCPTCHNFELAWSMEALPRVSRMGVLSLLRDRKTWLDGITITGGEPTTVPGLHALLEDVRSAGLPVKMDTNGMRPDVAGDLLASGLVDVFAVDVKGPWSKYPALTGNAVSAGTASDGLEAFFAMARKHPDRFYFRTTQVPALSDADIETVRGYLPLGFTLTVQQYKPPRRNHALADSEEGRTTGDVVQGPHRPGNLESPERQRDQGSPALQEACGQG